MTIFVEWMDGANTAVHDVKKYNNHGEEFCAWTADEKVYIWKANTRVITVVGE